MISSSYSAGGRVPLAKYLFCNKDLPIYKTAGCGWDLSSQHQERRKAASSLGLTGRPPNPSSEFQDSEGTTTTPSQGCPLAPTYIYIHPHTSTYPRTHSHTSTHTSYDPNLQYFLYLQVTYSKTCLTLDTLHLAKKISRQDRIQVVSWVLLSTHSGLVKRSNKYSRKSFSIL